MSMDMRAVERDEPFDDGDLWYIRRKSRWGLRDWEPSYRHGAEGRKPFGKRHMAILEEGIKAGAFTEAQVATWVAQHRLGVAS